jgi:N,N'-diacetyllegionaminate synthase
LSDIHIIAEAGTNHGGDPEVARRLIDAAAEASADSVKFQVIYPEGLYLPVTWEGGRAIPNETLEARRKQMLSDDDYRRLAAYAAERALPFSASVFDERGLDLLDSVDAPYIKIASCDLNNGPLLRAAAERGRTLILSTGMSTMQEVEQAITQVRVAGNVDLVLLHCVSVYPCPTAETNVGFVTRLLEAFGIPVGFSDHTENSVASSMAVALGATWIEKHLTLDRAAEGFDHHYAMDPTQFARFVEDVRAASSAVAEPPSKLGEAERAVSARARRGLYAARDLEVGTVLTEADVLIVRPPAALGPNDLDGAVGRPLVRPLRRYEPLGPEQLG